MAKLIRCYIAILFFLLIAGTAYANPPSSAQIVAWLINPEASNADPKSAIKIETTQEVILYSGEKAYVSGVSFSNSARNFWGGYILIRPKLKQSKIIEFGGQANTFTVHPIYLSKKNRAIDLIEFESAGSGQGSIEAAKSMTYIQDWAVKTLHEVNYGSFTGRWDNTLNDEDCKTGSDQYAYMHVIEQGKFILETTVETDACENKQPKDYDIKNQLIPIHIP